jgi:hypothetical protein
MATFEEMLLTVSGQVARINCACVPGHPTRPATEEALADDVAAYAANLPGAMVPIEIECMVTTADGRKRRATRMVYTAADFSEAEMGEGPSNYVTPVPTLPRDDVMIASLTAIKQAMGLTKAVVIKDQVIELPLGGGTVVRAVGMRFEHSGVAVKLVDLGTAPNVIPLTDDEPSVRWMWESADGVLTDITDMIEVE